MISVVPTQAFHSVPFLFQRHQVYGPGNIVFKNYIRLRYHRNNYITNPSIPYGNAPLLHPLYNGSSLDKKEQPFYRLLLFLTTNSRLGIASSNGPTD